MFAAHASEVRIRVYPDALHVHTHEPELTDEEVERAQRYWLDRWQTSDSALAWHTLAGQVKPVRAAWIARAVTPTNLGDMGPPPRRSSLRS